MSNTAGTEFQSIEEYANKLSPSLSGMTVPNPWNQIYGTVKIPAKVSNTAANFSTLLARQAAIKSIVDSLLEWRRDPKSETDIAFLDQMLRTLEDIVGAPIE